MEKSFSKVIPLMVLDIEIIFEEKFKILDLASK